MKICILDPGIRDNHGSNSMNLGDVIIQEAVTREVGSLFGTCDIVRVSTHAAMKREHISKIQDSKYVFVGGSNLLGNGIFSIRRLKWWRQWKVSLSDARQIGNAILLGVGWREYEGNTGWYTRSILREILSKQALHSVRDEYTAKKLRAIGFENVINTGCPTMWPLAELKQAEIPTHKADNVLIMLTDYRCDIELDAGLLEILVSNYKKVYCWPQGHGDRAYVSNFGYPVEMLDHSMDAIREFLETQDNCDCVGTRLHGGILCLFAKKRTLIIRIDNRAAEISRENSLPTIERDDFGGILRWIRGPSKIEIRINKEPIDRWKKQFRL
jgi:hypothetical protein